MLPRNESIFIIAIDIIVVRFKILHKQNPHLLYLITYKSMAHGGISTIPCYLLAQSCDTVPISSNIGYDI